MKKIYRLIRDRLYQSLCSHIFETIGTSLLFNGRLHKCTKCSRLKVIVILETGDYIAVYVRKIKMDKWNML